MTTKIPVELSSTPGIVDGSNATAITIDSSERIGIGTTSPSNLLHISSSTGDSVEMKITNTNADSIGANIHLEKDSASPADNDFCGEITWVGSNDNNQQPSFGSISVQMTDVSDGTEDGDMIFKTSGAGTFAERMRILSDGKVGIGETDPDGELHVKSAGNADVYVERTSGAKIHLQAQSALGNIGTSSNHDLGLMTNASVRMRIDSSGNVGIGMTPTHQLSVVGTGTATSINFGNVGASFPDTLGMFVSSTAHTQTAYGDLNIKARTDYGGYYGIGFFTASSNNTPALRMKIDSSGTLLIGKTTTADTTTGVKLQANAVMVQSASGTGAHDMHDFFRGTEGSLARVGNIRTTGSATAYNTSSDYRLKENVVTDWDATTRLKQLKPSRFNFIVDADTTVDGFLAHEVASIVPEAISGEKDAVDSEGNPEYQGIDQSKLVPLLVKTIQELEARIETLEG